MKSNCPSRATKQGLQLNPGAYTVKIVPVAGGEGHEEQVKIEADKVTIVKAQ
jgi:hypothetical protein